MFLRLLNDAVRKQGLASTKPKIKQPGCKRQTYQNKGFRNPPELREKSRILLMNKSVPLRLHKFCLYSERNNKPVGRNKTKQNNNRKF